MDASLGYSLFFLMFSIYFSTLIHCESLSDKSLGIGDGTGDFYNELIINSHPFAVKMFKLLSHVGINVSQPCSKSAQYLTKYNPNKQLICELYNINF